MKHRIVTLVLGFSALISLAAPFSYVAAAAADAPVVGADNGIGASDVKSDSFQLVPCDGVKVPCDFKAAVATFNRILQFLLYLSIPLVIGIILYTGFQFLTAGGDAMKLEHAKKMLIPVAIGIFWVLASWLIVNTILKAFLSDSTKAALQQNSAFQKLVK